nr:class I SAM-dependent methyltransferase [Spirochaetaceae bacterium]
MNKLFDPKKLNKLNNPERLKDLPPEYIWNKLNLDNPECIIDIGAGTGFYSVPFLNLMGKGIVYSCDISEIMINWLKENICKDYSGIVPLLIKNASVP